MIISSFPKTILEMVKTSSCAPFHTGCVTHCKWLSHSNSAPKEGSLSLNPSSLKSPQQKPSLLLIPKTIRHKYSKSTTNTRPTCCSPTFKLPELHVRLHTATCLSERFAQSPRNSLRHQYKSIERSNRSENGGIHIWLTNGVLVSFRRWAHCMRATLL